MYLDEEVSVEHLQKVLTEATRAANVESFHPWGFTFVGPVLFIKQYEPGLPDTSEVRCETTLVTLGVLIESLLLAAEDFQLKASFNLGGIEAVGPTPWATVRFTLLANSTDKELELSAKPDPTNKFVAAVETGRLMERARRLTKLTQQELL